MITLTQPIWLLLLVPLGVAWYLWPLPTPLLRFLRAMAIVSLVFAMTQPAIKLPDRSGTVVVIADRSDSMPENAGTRSRETIEMIQQGMSSRDRLGVVAFGQKSLVERAPQAGEFGGFTAQVGTDASSLGDAIESALALIPTETPGRIIVVSDGKWTGRDPGTIAARAAGRGIPIDHRFISRPQVADLAIQELHAPESVLPGEAYMVTAWVRSPVEQEIEFKLANHSRVIASGKRTVPAGLSRMMFRDRAIRPGTAEYKFEVNAENEDSVPENNRARALVGVRGTKPVLLVSHSGAESGLAELLKRGRVDVVAASHEQVNWSLEQLSQFSTVIIENVMAGEIGISGLEVLAAWVEETGSGLMMTGGKRTYAPGGYFGSPLERILPVSLEMRREHRKMALAIVVVLDRSGSMNAGVGGGKTKMDLANLGTAQVLDLLGPSDELGVIAVDSSPHTIVGLDTVDRVRSQRETILSIASMGGGIFVYSGLLAGSEMILQASAQTKHIILFSDARDSEEPGKYRELLTHCEAAGVTVSVIGLGQDTDVDADFLKDVALRGKGEIYFTDKPSELPRIFAQDTFTVARSTFVEEETAIDVTAGVTMLGGSSAWDPPVVGGYNLTYLRPEANLAIVSEDEYSAPIVASWFSANGRVLCFTPEADGEVSGKFANWDEAGDFYATMARWTAGEQQPLPEDMLLTQEVRDGVNRIRLHLDPEREKDPFDSVPEVTALHAIAGQLKGKTRSNLQWKDADTLETLIPIRGAETVMATVLIPGEGPHKLPPVCLPYSAEFVPDQPDRGRKTLEKISSISGGMERLELPTIWETLEAVPQYIDFAVYLILAGLLAFLMEVFQRRTGLLQVRMPAGRERKEAVKPTTESAAPPASGKPSWLNLLKPKLQARAKSAGRGVKKTKSGSKQTGTAPAKPADDSAKPKDSQGANISAMKEAMNRAKRRRRD